MVRDTINPSTESGHVRTLASRRDPPRLRDWFHVTWSDAAVELDVAPPGSDAWRASFKWSSVTKVCLQAEGSLASDGIYVFTADRPESYAIPTEADGGAGFWEEILRRGLFDSELAVTAAQSPGGLYCWPPTENADQG
jgi:hypothetical protein